MLLVAILALMFVVINVVSNVLAGLPAIPDEAFTFIHTATPYLVQGIKIVNSFTHAEIVIPLVLFEVAAFEVYRLYRLVMWVAEKVPMLGVE